MKQWMQNVLGNIEIPIIIYTFPTMFVCMISVAHNSVTWNIQGRYNHLYPTKEENEAQIGEQFPQQHSLWVVDWWFRKRSFYSQFRGCSAPLCLLPYSLRKKTPLSCVW